MGQKTPDLSGRGARTNRAGRFEALSCDAFDDGWAPDEEPPKLDTVITQEIARTIISHNDSPDLHFDQSINTYRGCEHGCIYCYARPNHAYAGLSPGLDFETRLFAKTNAAALLEGELAARNYKPRTIVLGGVTDCYQPAERERRITRGVLEVLQRHRHPVAIVTKSALVQRDIDILSEMARDRLVKVGVSVTTLDRKLARAMEPRAAAPHRRLEAITALTRAGIPVTVMTAPMIPAVNDRELEALLEAGRDAGAREASYVVLRLPLEISELFQEWLAAHFPDRAAHVMSLVRQMRGGKDYDSDWGLRQKGTGPYAKLIADRFRRACERLGLNIVREGLDATRFRRVGDQMQLF